MQITKQDFIKYLSHPENLNGYSISSLETLVKEYPYFQTGRLLYVKNLNNLNSISYEKNLHIASAYAPTGKMLYHLIKKTTKSNHPDHTTLLNEQTVTEPSSSCKQPSLTDSISSHIAASNEINLKEEALAILHEEPVMMKKNILKSSDIKTAETMKDEYDELQILEKEILKETLQTSMQFDLLNEKDTRNEIKSSNFSNQQAVSDNKKHGQYSFNEWLSILSGQTLESTQEKTTHKLQTVLIDRFILEESSKTPSKPKAEFYSAEAMAKKSIMDDETFVTETLAGIYLRQGNLPKALRAYEILMIKHPEKIHIFAPLLEKIKNLLKKQNG